jgi:hypothetical protein
MREDDAGEAQTDEPSQGAECHRDQRDQGDPLDRPLARSDAVTLERS